MDYVPRLTEQGLEVIERTYRQIQDEPNQERKEEMILDFYDTLMDSPINYRPISSAAHQLVLNILAAGGIKERTQYTRRFSEEMNKAKATISMASRTFNDLNARAHTPLGSPETTTTF